MKIFIDINHPAHVHYFRNIIKVMNAKGHTFIVTNRNLPIINQLLDYYQIKHFVRNSRPQSRSIMKSMFYLMGMIKNIIKYSIIYNPDIYVAFGSFPCAITAFFFRRPCILIDDTEHNKVSHTLNKPFYDTVLTPFYFHKKLGKGQLYFQAYVEQLYLHSSVYKPTEKVYEWLNLPKDQSYALVRYISYDASHDNGVKYVSEEAKKELILYLSKYMPVFVSLENEVNDSFYEKYKLSISPEKMHDVMKNASFILS